MICSASFARNQRQPGLIRNCPARTLNPKTPSYSLASWLSRLRRRAWASSASRRFSKPCTAASQSIEGFRGLLPLKAQMFWTRRIAERV